MGLFDFLKKNKNIITDNGIKVLSTKEKEDIENYNNKWNANKIFIINLIEIDRLISEITGANLIIQMLNKTLSNYARLIENKSSKYYEGELFRVYLFYKRNYFIKHLITSNKVSNIDDYDLNILFSNHINEVKNEIDIEIRKLPKHIIRFHITQYISLRESLIHNIFLVNDNNIKLLSSFYEVHRSSTRKYFNLSPEEFSFNIFYQECILFGIKPDILILINKIINNAPNSISTNYFGEYETFDDTRTNLINEIITLSNNNKINQDEIILDIKNINIQDFEKKTELEINKTQNILEFYERGIEKDLNSDYEGAIIDFTKAIEIDGGYIDAYRGRAMAKLWLRDYEGAISDYTKIIDFNSEDIEAFENRGRAKASLKDYIGAIDDFNKTIAIDNESKVYSSRGRMKKNLLDFDGALLDYNIAVEKYPEDDSCIFGRGLLKYEIEDYHGAIKDFNKCIEIKPNRIMFFHKRGDCKLKIEDYKGAIEDYSIVIQNRQDKYGIDGPSSENGTNLFSSLYHKRGVARSKINKYTDAITDFKKAIELNPNCIDEVNEDIELTIKQQG